MRKKILHLALTGALLPITHIAAADDQPTAAASAATPAAANETPTVLPTVEVKEVSAVSVGRGSNVEKMDVSTTIVSREQIQNAPEYNLDQILNRVMGVWTSSVPANQADPTGTVVGMRGMGNTGGEKVLVMVDGVPVNDGYFKTVDWSQIPKDTIERVEIIRGGGGAALWGNLAMGGVINVITREPDDKSRIGFGYGSFNTKKGDASTTLFKNDVLKVGVSYNVIESDGYNTAPKYDQVTPNLVASNTRTHNVLLSNYLTPTANSKFFVKFGFHELLQDQITQANMNNQWYKYDYRGGGEIKFSENRSLNINSFFNYSSMDKVNGSLSSPTGTVNYTLPVANLANSVAYDNQREAMNYQTYGGSVFMQDKFQGSWGELKDVKYGFDARGITTADTNNILKEVGVTANTYVTGTYDMGGVNNFEGIFAQGTYSPRDTPLDVTLGLRQDWYQANTVKSNFQRGGTASLPPSISGVGNQQSQSFDQFNPRLGLKYSFANGIDLRGAVYRNYAAPGMNQLYRTFASGSTVTIGNNTLTPESSFGQEIGIDFNAKTVRTRFTLYHVGVDNLMQSTALCGASGTPACASNSATQAIASNYGVSAVKEVMNVGTGTMEGGEVFAEWDATDKLTLNASAERTIAFIDQFNSQFAALNSANQLAMTSRQLPNVPTLMLLFGGKYRATDDLQLGFSVKSWPKYYTTTLTTQANLYSNTVQNSGATTADLWANYQAFKGFDLYVTAQNVSNATYIQTNTNGTGAAAVMGMPRNVFGGFRYTF
jgi:outer membrane receptor protein involved in Fe transport